MAMKSCTSLRSSSVKSFSASSSDVCAGSTTPCLARNLARTFSFSSFKFSLVSNEAALYDDLLDLGERDGEPPKDASRS